MKRPRWFTISSLVGLVLFCCGLSGLCSTAAIQVAIATPSPAIPPTLYLPPILASTSAITLTTFPATSTYSPSPSIEFTATPLSTDTVYLSPTETPPPTATSSPKGFLHIYVLDVGQGLSVLIIAPSGQAALFDGGPTVAGPTVVSDLHKFGVSRLDIVFASHAHEDHIGGEINILKTFPVSKIVTNGQSNTTSTYEHWLDAALASNADYVEAARGSSFPLGDLVLQVYSPPAPQPTGDLNHNSLVVRFVYGQHAYLLMGDADQATEGDILSFGSDVRSDVLQAGHHCSSDASGIIFLQAVRPKYAVCSSGAGNPYGHPHDETLQRLLNVGSTIFRTDLNGTIAFTSDGTTLSVEAER